MPDQTLIDIKDRLNIADVLSGYIQLKKSGVNFKAVCPFHNEKSPSLMVSTQKQIWHCFGCFPPGQKVKTPFGYHKIEDIPEDHYVISGSGSLKKVLATHNRMYKGNLVNIGVNKLSGIVSLTEDHNVFVVRPKAPYLGKTKNFYRRYKVYQGLFFKDKDKYFKKIDKYAPCLKLPAGKINRGDLLLYPIRDIISPVLRLDLKDYLTKKYHLGPRPKNIPYEVVVDDNLLRLIGYYIAEGSNNRAYIRFSLGLHEEDFAAEIINLIKKVFNLDAKVFRKTKIGNSGMEITACHANLAEIFGNLCGKGAAQKHIPFIFQDLPFRQQMVLVNAVLKGDGHSFLANKSSHKHHSITTISQILAEQILDILLRNGIYPSSRIQKAKIDKKGISHREAYCVYWSTEAKSQHPYVYFKPDGSKFWMLPIKTLKIKSYEGPVHNLTIEDDHSYVAQNFAVANCGEGGDIFGFVMKYENLEFRDAIKLLADKAGVKLPEYRPKDQAVINKEDQLYKINDFAARFYHEILIKGQQSGGAREYLKKRGLSTQTIEQWKIGFAPEGFHTLEQALVQKKVELNDLVSAGVSAKNERGQIYDRFRNRITFPIFSAVGNIVGFSARILMDDGKSAKYINSPETAIYNKSKVLFGFNFARTDIRKLDEVIVVEGQMDCIACHQAGFKNVVASSGTALTVEQLTQIGRFTKNIKFCFDTDAAGLMATRRAVENALSQGFTIKILSLSGAKDPDELIKKDPKEFARQSAQAPLFLDFYITKQFQNFNQTIAEKKQVEAELLPLFNLLTDPLELDHYLRIVAEKLGTTPHVLLETLHKLKKTVLNNPQKNIEVVSALPVGPNGLEKQVLGGMLLYPEFLQMAVQEGVINDFIHPQAKALAEAAIKGQKIDNENLLAKECIFMVESQLAEHGNTETMVKELKKSYAQLKLVAIRTEQKKLTDEIRQAELEKNSARLLVLNQEFMNLNVKRLSLEKLL